MAGESYRLEGDLLIDTREDNLLTGVTILSGESAYTREFGLRRDGNVGALGLYIDCSGPGNFTLEYETDPGNERGERAKDGSDDDWFPADYSNPLREAFPTGRSSTPICAVVGQYIKFKITAVGGDVTINYIKLVIQ